MPPPLKWSCVPLLILLAYLVSGCTPIVERYTNLETRLIAPLQTQAVLLQVDYGEVQLLESKDRQIHVDGQTLFADELEYVVDSTESLISIQIYSHNNRSSSAPLRVNILMPPHLQVRIEAEAASIRAKDFQGNLEISSTSGDIALEQMAGEMALYSNRGSIAVRDSSGKISIVGNYGMLSAQNVRGDVGISTIMGNVVFGGLIGEDDTIRLETDHGSVSVNLSPDSDLRLQVRSTSGEIACMVPKVVASTRTCDGEIESGKGSLSIRTVSGAVTLQATP